jgi:hypothetical protein
MRLEEERGLISIYGQGEISYTADDSQLPMDEEWVKLKHVLEIAVIVAPSSRSIQIQVPKFVDVDVIFRLQSTSS